MKRLLILSLTCFVLASCSKEQAAREGIPMRVDPSLDGTKASITTETLQEFWLNVVCPADDKFSYLAEFRKENDKWDVASRMFWKDENASVDYCAASFGGHAFTKEEFAGSVDLAVPADQSSQEKLNSADLLTLKKTTVSYKDTKEGILPVKFSHGMTKVSISFTLTDVFYNAGWGLTLDPITSVKLKGANLGFSFQPETGTVTVKENSTADVTPMPFSYKPSSSKSKNAIAVYEAILPAQTIKNGSLEIEFRIGSGDYYWKNIGDVVLEAGKNHTLYVITAKIPPYQSYIRDHRYVEMGHGLKWATCNVGAENDYDNGILVAWGETTSKNNYSSSNYTGADHDALQPADDAATVNWGAPWRTPTKEELNLFLNPDEYTCTYVSDYNNTGIGGWTITTKISPYEGNTIFLPFAGYQIDANRFDGQGSYWASSLNDNPANPYCLVINPETIQLDGAGYSRWYGLTVRPVAN